MGILFWQPRTIFHRGNFTVQLAFFDIWVGLFIAPPEAGRLKLDGPQMIRRSWYLCLIPCIVFKYSIVRSPVGDEWSLCYDETC